MGINIQGVSYSILQPCIELRISHSTHTQTTPCCTRLKSSIRKEINCNIIANISENVKNNVIPDKTLKKAEIHLSNMSVWLFVDFFSRAVIEKLKRQNNFKPETGNSSIFQRNYAGQCNKLPQIAFFH